MRAHELVYEKPFQELLGQVDNETTILMGHTRWRTRGNEFNNRNNHPIRAGIVIGTHNGTIYNAIICSAVSGCRATPRCGQRADLPPGRPFRARRPHRPGGAKEGARPSVAAR